MSLIAIAIMIFGGLLLVTGIAVLILIIVEANMIEKDTNKESKG